MYININVRMYVHSYSFEGKFGPERTRIAFLKMYFLGAQFFFILISKVFEKTGVTNEVQTFNKNRNIHNSLHCLSINM
jgi:hypothetical protein